MHRYILCHDALTATGRSILNQICSRKGWSYASPAGGCTLIGSEKEIDVQKFIKEINSHNPTMRMFMIGVNQTNAASWVIRDDSELENWLLHFCEDNALK